MVHLCHCLVTHGILGVFEATAFEKDVLRQTHNVVPVGFAVVRTGDCQNGGSISGSCDGSVAASKDGTEVEGGEFLDDRMLLMARIVCKASVVIDTEGYMNKEQRLVWRSQVWY